MSMNRLVGLGIFALSAYTIVNIAACDNSATTMTAQGGTPAAYGGEVGQGGGSTTGQGGGSTANGGSTGSGTPGACTADTDLIADAATSTTKSWIGGDPASSTDDPCGVQGAVYAYSDDGLDKSPGTSDDSVQSPAKDPAASDPKGRLSPCNGTKCCISGQTSKWPTSGGTSDYTASVWGGGLGVSLGDPGGGGTKKAYAGSIKGFAVTISGTLNGQVLRIQYTQTATDTCAPYKQVTGPGTYQVLFTDATVACPTWACTPACVKPTNAPYDLQVQVVGGDAAGAFEVCIDNIKPIL
jgi:hypothetical protein